MVPPPLFIFLSCILLAGCRSEPSATARDYEQVVPHAQTDGTANTKLNQKDLRMLERAVGKEAQPFDDRVRTELFVPTNKVLTLVQVYRLDCAACLRTNRSLEAIRADWSERDLRVVYLNLDAPRQLDNVNLQLRTSNLTGPVYQIDSAALRRLPGVNWNGALPFLVAAHPAEDLLLTYPQEFSRDALTALVETLVF